MASSFIVLSRRVVLPDGVRPAAICVRNGVIAEIGDYERPPWNARVEDMGDRVVMPGLVDTHVHINEPGRTDWEGFETATQAAAAGGITTLVDMPLNSSPVTTTADALAAKRQATAGKIWVDVGFHGGIVPGNEAEIEPLLRAGVLGFKAFLVHSGIDDFPAATEKELRAVMPRLAQYGVPLSVHAELDRRGAPAPRDPRSYREYLASRPRKWEQDAIEMMIELCRATRCPTHIVHLASADAIPVLTLARESGLPLTIETCPHYLFFAAEDIPDAATSFKCAPPIRERENREQLWRALHGDVIDMVVSDHSPCPPGMKQLGEGDFMKAWGGIASLQLGLSIIWTAARERGFSPEHLARWMSAAPARLAGLEKKKGRIAPGFDADLVVWNPETSFRVEAEKLYHRHKLTPYEGVELHGVVDRVYLRGERVAENGVVFAGPKGKMLTRST